MTTPDIGFQAPQRAVINLWQRGVPVYNAKVNTWSFRLLLLLIVIATVIAITRLLGSLGPFSGMNDAYAWGVWKTFNVMALTALGSSAMAVGIAAWVFGRRNLHSVMRTAIVTSLLFYCTGLLGLLTDVGRPWNFWNMLLPWRWNTDSALWEVSIAMPIYAVVFLAFEASPIIVERIWFVGSPKRREMIMRWRPRMRKVYPFMVAGAYVIPMMHQSSLGALMLLAGPKVHPLWQTASLPLLYLVQAAICGFAFLIVCLMTSCLFWRRPLDTKVLGDLGSLMSWTIIAWFIYRMVDVVWRGQTAAAFSTDIYGGLFWTENLMVLIPAVVLRARGLRRIPRVLFLMSLLACVGGLLYRFSPTTVSFNPGEAFRYFPTVPEIFVTAGLIALAVAGFSLAVKYFAILPAPVRQWYQMVRYARRHAHEVKGDEHGNPYD